MLTSGTTNTRLRQQLRGQLRTWALRPAPAFPVIPSRGPWTSIRMAEGDRGVNGDIKISLYPRRTTGHRQPSPLVGEGQDFCVQQKSRVRGSLRALAAALAFTRPLIRPSGTFSHKGRRGNRALSDQQKGRLAAPSTFRSLRDQPVFGSRCRAERLRLLRIPRQRVLSHLRHRLGIIIFVASHQNALSFSARIFLQIHHPSLRHISCDSEHLGKRISIMNWCSECESQRHKKGQGKIIGLNLVLPTHSGELLITIVLSVPTNVTVRCMTNFMGNHEA